MLTRRQATLALGSLACLAGRAQAQTLERFTVAGWSQAISEITNLLAEPDKGFFRAQGIALDYVPGTGGGSAIQTLLTGQGDIAFTDPAAFYLALDKGERLVAIYNIYPQNVFNVVAKTGSGIRTPADLKGKRIGVYSLSSGTRQNLQMLLHQVGLSEKDVTIEVTGLLNFAPLIQGQVDATAATDTGLLVARQKGVGEVHVIEVRDTLNIPSDIFVVRAADYEAKKAAAAAVPYRLSRQCRLDDRAAAGGGEDRRGRARSTGATRRSIWRSSSCATPPPSRRRPMPRGWGISIST